MSDKTAGQHTPPDGGDPKPDGGNPGSETPFNPPVNRMVMAILALLGFLISLYMLAYALGFIGTVMCGLGECEKVQSSSYSWIGPLPVAGLGVVGYLVFMGVSFLGLQPTFRASRMIPAALLAGGFAGVAFSAYLTYLEAFVIQAWCQWCVMSAIIMVLAFLACLPELRRIGGPS